MKKSIAVLLALVLLLPFCAAAFADAETYVYDHDDHLTDEEETRLNDLAAKYYRQYGYDILFDMDEGVAQSAVPYAQRRYAEAGGGKNGVLLAITADEWHIHLAGEAEQAFTEAYVDWIWERYDAEATYFEGAAIYIMAAGVVLKQHYGEAEEEGAEAEPPQIPETRQKPRLVDDAGLLDAEQGDALHAMLDEISERQACDVAVVTVHSLDGKTAEAYADDYYDYNGYGMGDGDDGILLLISMEDRDWAITTYGFAIPAFTDAGQAYMVDRFRPDLSRGEYAAAFTRFAELCDDFLRQAKTGEPYDKGNLPKVSPLWVYFLTTFGFFLPLGFVLSLIISNKMKKSLLSVAPQRAASSYVRKGSLRITSQRDTFLYKTVTKTAIASESDSDDDRGGGSSTHTSSSGRSHGGSSGKF